MNTESLAAMPIPPSRQLRAATAEQVRWCEFEMQRLDGLDVLARMDEILEEMFGPKGQACAGVLVKPQPKSAGRVGGFEL